MDLAFATVGACEDLPRANAAGAAAAAGIVAAVVSANSESAAAMVESTLVSVSPLCLCAAAVKARVDVFFKAGFSGPAAAAAEELPAATVGVSLVKDGGPRRGTAAAEAAVAAGSGFGGARAQPGGGTVTSPKEMQSKNQLDGSTTQPTPSATAAAAFARPPGAENDGDERVLFIPREPVVL